MNHSVNTNDILCARIAEPPKNAGLTQDALADRLGITFQAVSKWENKLACPDITLLPALSEVFGVSIDSLFGIEPAPKEERTSDGLTRAFDWKDDGKLRAVLFIGTRLVAKEDLCAEKSAFTFEYEGDALDVISDFSIACGDIAGNVSAASGSVNCGDIGGNVATKYGEINCGDIGGDVTTNNGSISCGDVNGDLTTASGTISCSDVDGDVTTNNGSISCGDVNGDLTTASGTISCSDIDGDITIGDGKSDVCISCGDVEGKITIGVCTGEVIVECGDIEGDIAIQGNGNVTVSSDVEGNITATNVTRE